MNQVLTDFNSIPSQPIIEKEPAGFWIRLAAYVIDMILTRVILAMISTPIWLLKLMIGEDHVIFHNILFSYNIFDILNYLLIAAYFVIMTYTTGRTVGKMLMKIRVQSANSRELTFSQVAFREVIGKYLSGILYIGYIMAGISTKKSALHDCLADTKVVYDTK